MKFTGIKETCLYVSDLAATRAFYEGKLGLEFLSMLAGKYIFFRAGHSVLLCFVAEQSRQTKGLPPHGADGSIHFALEVLPEDYDATLQAVREAGIKVLQEQVWKGDKRSFYFQDPDGHLAEIVEAGLWDAAPVRKG